MPTQANLTTKNKTTPKIRRKRTSTTLEPDSRLAALNLLQGKPTSPTQALTIQRHYGNRAMVGALDTSQASPTLQRAWDLDAGTGLLTKPDDINRKWLEEAGDAKAAFAALVGRFGISTMASMGLGVADLGADLLKPFAGTPLMAKVGFATKEERADFTMAMNIGKFVLTCALVTNPLGFTCAAVILLAGVSEYLDAREKIEKEKRQDEIADSIRGKLENIIKKHEQKLAARRAAELYGVGDNENRMEKDPLGKTDGVMQSYSSNDYGAAVNFIDAVDWRLTAKIDKREEAKRGSRVQCVSTLLSSKLREKIEGFRKRGNRLSSTWDKPQLIKDLYQVLEPCLREDEDYQDDMGEGDMGGVRNIGNKNFPEPTQNPKFSMKGR